MREVELGIRDNQVRNNEVEAFNEARGEMEKFRSRSLRNARATTASDSRKRTAEEFQESLDKIQGEIVGMASSVASRKRRIKDQDKALQSFKKVVAPIPVIQQNEQDAWELLQQFEQAHAGNQSPTTMEDATMEDVMATTDDIDMQEEDQEYQPDSTRIQHDNDREETSHAVLHQLSDLNMEIEGNLDRQHNRNAEEPENQDTSMAVPGIQQYISQLIKQVQERLVSLFRLFLFKIKILISNSICSPQSNHDPHL